MLPSPENPLTTPEFYKRNDDLAKRYNDASPSARQNILLDLYRLDLRLFQGWRVFGSEDKEDYQQEAAIWLDRALTSYKPTKGPFVAHLRWYILKTFNHHVKTHKSKAAPLDESHDVSDNTTETAHDPLFWRKVKRAVTPEEWALIVLRFHEGKGIEEIARLRGTHAERIRGPLNRAVQAIKAASMSKLAESQKETSHIDASESVWMSPQHLSPKIGFSVSDINRFCASNLDPSQYPIAIDPRDFLRLSRKRLRIRFLESPQGLTYPRFTRRGKAVGRQGYL